MAETDETGETDETHETELMRLPDMPLHDPFIVADSESRTYYLLRQRTDLDGGG